MNLRYLTENYIPDKILFRESQIEEIEKSLEQYKTFGKGKNLLVRGTSGTGKTATLKYITHKYNGFIKYTSGVKNEKWMSIIRDLSGLDYRYSDKLISTFLKHLNQEPRAIIIDEISKIMELDRLMQKLNLIYRETQIPIIVATNNINFIDNLESDVKLTLFFQPVEFVHYTVDELKQILDERLKLAECELPEDLKNLIVGISKKENSARILLELAYYSLVNNDFDTESLKRYADKYRDSDYKKIIDNLSYNAKSILRDIINLYENNKVIDSFKLREKTTLTKGRMTQILDEFEDEYGLIESFTINKGRPVGKVREIKITQDTYKRLKDIM